MEIDLPPIRPTLGSQIRTLLPLYLTGLVITLCGIGAVNSTVMDASLATATVTLTVLGFVVSLVLRLARVDPNYALYPALGIGLFIVSQRYMQSGSFAGALGGPVQGGWQPDIALATFLSWVVVLLSFTLLTNNLVLFCPVPAVALLGLTGSSNLNGEIAAYFFVFLFATLFLAGYEHYLRLQELARREPEPLLRTHATTAVILFALVMVTGGALTLVGRPILARLSPFTGAVVRKAQQSLPSFSAALQNSSNFVPVGAGPMDLSETPIMDVYAPEAGAQPLWRTRVFAYYNGRGWAAQPNEMRETIYSEETARIPRPPGLAEGEEFDSEGFSLTLTRDRHVDRTVRIQPVKQLYHIRTSMPPVLPALARAVHLRYPGERVAVELESGILLGQMYLMSGFTYEVTSEVKQWTPDQLRALPPVAAGAVDPQYLDFPTSLRRVRDLARQITQGARTPYDKAVAIQSWLEANCPYSLIAEPAPRDRDAVEHYLFTTKEGACDLIGSAMALMCRAVGVPARVATGYASGIRDNELNAYSVRAADAHLWVELFFPRYGWVSFNPAPTPLENEQQPQAASVATRARRIWRGFSRRACRRAHSGAAGARGDHARPLRVGAAPAGAASAPPPPAAPALHRSAGGDELDLWPDGDPARSHRLAPRAEPHAGRVPGGAAPAPVGRPRRRPAARRADHRPLPVRALRPRRGLPR
jgi:transglutaminase-like putative cysteine protease